MSTPAEDLRGGHAVAEAIGVSRLGTESGRPGLTMKSIVLLREKRDAKGVCRSISDENRLQSMKRYGGEQLAGLRHQAAKCHPVSLDSTRTISSIRCLTPSLSTQCLCRKGPNFRRPVDRRNSPAVNRVS